MKITQDQQAKTLTEALHFLEKNLAEKESEITELTSVNTKLNSVVEDLTSTVEDLSSTVEDLKFQVAQFQRMLFGSKRERFESNQHPDQLAIPFEIAEEKIDAIIEEEKQQISFERKKPAKPHPGRMELPSHLPVVEIILEPKEDVSEMTCIGNEITQELEYTPAHLHINKYIRRVYIKKEDELGNQVQVIAELDRPMPKCIAGPDLISQIMVDKFVYHLPLYRQLQRFAQERVHIKASTLDSWFSLGSNHIRPLFAVHRAYILENPYLQVDESPIKVLDHDKPGATHQGYMWVYHAPMQNAVFFDYNKGRGANAPFKNLSTFKGYLQTDGYSVYEQFARDPEVTHLACMAHARRMFEKALDNDKARASVVLLLIQKLYAIESTAREGGLSAGQRYTMRLDESLPILNQISKFIADNRSKVLPRSPIGKAFDYCIHRWDNLMNYLKDGNLEIDNNLIENSIRPLALGRKNYLFAGSHAGAENIAMYYSFFGTCKKHDVNPQKWLAYVIRNINDTKSSQLKYLLPQFITKNLLE
jgi:transposase